MPRSNSVKEDDVQLNKKELKKVTKLEAQIPYFAARKQNEDVDKIQNQIDAIWEKARSSRDF